MSTFSDPQAVARYAEAPLRQVPGFLALQQMSQLGGIAYLGNILPSE